MLTIEEIKNFMNEDALSEKKKQAAIGDAYYNAEHDIKEYRIFYYNSDGELVEDKYNSNYKIPHPFFSELVDQATQYILSGDEQIIKSDMPELQAEMDSYFNENEDFMSELSEILTDGQTKGFSDAYAYINEEGKIAFQCADSLGVIEIRAKDTDDGCEYVIYHYVDRIDKGQKQIKRIQVWDSKEIYYYVQDGDGEIELDTSAKINPKPHTLFKKEKDDKTYFKDFGFIPFFRFKANKKQVSFLKPIKPLIDDYDLMSSGLTNNLADFDKPTYVIKGYEGDDLEALQKNLSSRKLIGLDEEGGMEVHTVDIPYQARITKLELDEKNIYRFGFGLNMAGLKDTSATTNIAIKAMYALLDLKCSKLIIRLKQFLRKLIKIVLDEINENNGTDYQLKDVYFNFKPETMSNAQENAQIALTEAQTRQADITTLLNLAAKLDNETLMQLICEVMDLDWNKIKGKLPDPDEADSELNAAQDALNGIEGGDIGEQAREGNTASIPE